MVIREKLTYKWFTRVTPARGEVYFKQTCTLKKILDDLSGYSTNKMDKFYN